MKMEMEASVLEKTGEAEASIQSGVSLRDHEVVRGSFRARAWLKSHGYPYSDNVELRASPLRFPDGGNFAVEIPVINTLDVLKGTVAALKEEGIPCTRFNETHGSILLSDSEIREMLSLCAESGYGIAFSIGPRPEYDRKAAFYRGKFGLEQGRRVNNNDAIANSVEEVLRLVDLGCRGVIVYDMGVMRILSEMRESGNLPQDLFFKASSHCIVSNPVTAKIWEELGVDSVTVLHDVDLVVLQEMRRMTNGLILDVPIDVYDDKGGFIRYNEIPEIVQVAAPVILKMGASAQVNPYDQVNLNTVKKRVRRVALGLEYLERSGIPTKFAAKAAPFWCHPSL